MKRCLPLVIVSFFLINHLLIAQEQQQFRIGVGAGFILPIAKVGKIYNPGVGGEVQGTYGLTDNIAAFAQAGASFFSYKNTPEARNSTTTTEGSTMSMASFIVGGRYHCYGLVVGLGVGYANFNDNGDLPGSFIYVPQIGYNYRNVDILFNYTGAGATGKTSGVNYSAFGIKIFYNFLWAGNVR